MKSRINRKDVRRTPMVVVEWEDAASSPQWRDYADLRPRETVRIVSAGFCVRRTEREIILAVSLSGRQSDEGRVGDVLAIPLGCVRKVRRLKRPR